MSLSNSELFQISFQQGANGYLGTSDTMLREYRPTRDYGSAAILSSDLEDGGSGAETQTLLRFGDIFGTGPGQIPLGATITSATLSLDTTSTGDGAKLHRILSPWAESDTWSSLGGGIQIDGLEAATSADAFVGEVNNYSNIFINVTNSLQAWSDGADNDGWVFQSSGTDGWDFRSSEGTIRPQLSVTYTLDDVVGEIPGGFGEVPDSTGEIPSTGWLSATGEQSFNGYVGGPPTAWAAVSSNGRLGAVEVSPSGSIHRFHSRYGERRSDDSTSVDRVELNGGKAANMKWASGTDIWISYNFMVEEQKPGEPDYSGGWTILGQLHAGNGKNPIVTMNLKDNDTFAIYTRPGAANLSDAQNGSKKVLRYQMDNFERGEDYNVMMHIKSAPSGKGSVFDVWIDGKQVVDLSDIPLGYTDADTVNFWKWGVYRATNPIPLDVQFANVEAGTVDLSGRILNPLPVHFGTPDMLI